MGAHASVAATPEWNDTALAVAVRAADVAAIEARVQAQAARGQTRLPLGKTSRSEFECRTSHHLVSGVREGRGRSRSDFDRFMHSKNIGGGLGAVVVETESGW